MKTGMSKNKYGTLVSIHICNTCGTKFTVCPAIFDEQKGWGNCLGKDCKSYNRSRDVDLFFNKVKKKPIIKLLPN